MLASLRSDDRSVLRGRTLLVVGVALATTAAAIAVPLAMRHESAPAPGEPTGSEIWRDRLSLPLPANLIYDSRSFSRKLQGMVLDGGNTRTTCVLTAYTRGVLDPKTIPAGSQQVTINGARGSVITVEEPYEVIDEAKKTAVTTGGVQDRLPAARLHRRQPVGEPAERLDQRGAEQLHRVHQRWQEARHDARQRGPAGARLDLRIAYLTGAQASSVKQPKPQPDLTINGRDAWFQSEGLIIKGTGFAVRLENLAGLTRAELVKIASGLELAPNPNDPSTWFDAATAIP